MSEKSTPLIPSNGSYIVSWDISHGKDESILLVGKKEPGKPAEIVNAFSGKEAEDLLFKLSGNEIKEKK